MLFVTSRQYECGNQLLSSQDATLLLQHMSAILKMDNHMILHVTEDLLNIVDMTMRGKNQSIYLYRAVKESLICTKIYFYSFSLIAFTTHVFFTTIYLYYH